MATKDRSLIHSPPHYIEGRKIQPIDVIEFLNLNHHLACVVKYVCRAGRKNPILDDLRKGEWYLERYLMFQHDLRQEGGIFNNEQENSPLLNITAEEVCEDWQLSSNLSGVIINMFLACEARPLILPEKALRAALEHLKEEISLQEQGIG